MPEPVTMIAVGGGIVTLGAHLARRYFEVAKEICDIAMGAVAFLLALPVVLLSMLIVRLSSRGPVMFKQVRVGKDGQLFVMYKLRTMYLNAEDATGAVWAQDDDPRVIPACRWMRRSHVDELPQLINVIKGDMSLVGPRPERPEILEKLQQAYPLVRQRLSVRPGITGLAQVRNGYDSTVEAFRNKLAADLEYIERRSWGMEFAIIAMTFAKFNDKRAK